MMDVKESHQHDWMNCAAFAQNKHEIVADDMAIGMSDEGIR
jgi:hypothetical protein